ncbi:MAG: glycosyltransferase [Chloroflexi bacterium]|nr:glycosyltransferase [Chloroflexota bacterium]
MSMGNPLVTVVMAVYNGERFLRAALDSALAQTYQPLEVITINDGSTDGSAKVLASYGGRVTVLAQANADHGAAGGAPVNPSDSIRCDDAKPRAWCRKHSSAGRGGWRRGPLNSVLDVGNRVAAFPAAGLPSRIGAR